MLSKKKLQDLVREIDPNEQLDEDVEEVRFHVYVKFIVTCITWYLRWNKIVKNKN